MNPAQLKQFKTQAHLLKPVLIVGQSGLTKSVLQELEITLDTHELIKIKIRAERDERVLVRDQIITESKAELVQSIGQIIVIYRKKPKQKKEKSTAPRRR
ncbi:MAG: YhbY family RNA-binding protein [Methylococcales symbiont of Hymedesmia sp. n. MRB-2018]|nr:MAG: YhbY family RNA-binding protein [Methylococcales symbiont of Hymedesmia sp. n. MRB-2018]